MDSIHFTVNLGRLLLALFLLFDIAGCGGGSSSKSNLEADPGTSIDSSLEINPETISVSARGGVTVVVPYALPENSSKEDFTYQWVQHSGVEVVLLGDTNAALEFIAPYEVGSVAFSVIAVDENQNSTQTNVVVEIVRGLVDVLQLAVHDSHACALDLYGVMCWGENKVGQASVPTLSAPSEVAVSYGYSCALESTQMVCWGDVPFTAPQDLNGSKNLILNSDHACVIEEGKVKCWSDDDASPLLIPDELTNVDDIAFSGAGVCALALGEISCMGTESYTHWFEAPGDLPHVNKLDAYSNKICALVNEGIRCWQISGEVSELEVTAFDSEEGLTLLDLDAHFGGGCVLTLSQQVECWSDESSVIDTPFGPDTQVKLMSYDSNFLCAVTVEDKIECVRGSFYSYNGGAAHPSKMDQPLTMLESSQYQLPIRAFSCAADGVRFYCWGSAGWLTDFVGINKLNLTSPIKDISIDTDNVVFLLEDDSFVSAGRVSGQPDPDDESGTIPLDFPANHVVSHRNYFCFDTQPQTCYGDTEIYDSLFSWSAGISIPQFIEAGDDNICAIENNILKCWGTEIEGLKEEVVLNNALDLTVGRNHACVIDDGEVECWAGGSRVVLDREHFLVADIPFTFENAKAVSSSDMSACVLDDNGVQCWGYEFEGPFNGEVRTNHLIVPERLVNPRAISVGGNHTCALDDNGVQCWGGLITINL
ncbi:MAG: hypothetical protein KUG82_12750 [Pseudomonadales bacterium]|nr:hypothetical protein [Pseudomonadales bacterium]